MPVSSQPPQLRQGEMFIDCNLKISTSSPVPLMAELRSSSVLPPSLGLPLKAMIFKLALLLVIKLIAYPLRREKTPCCYYIS